MYSRSGYFAIYMEDMARWACSDPAVLLVSLHPDLKPYTYQVRTDKAIFGEISWTLCLARNRNTPIRFISIFTSSTTTLFRRTTWIHIHMKT